MGYPVAARNSFLDSHITGSLNVALYTVAPNDEGVGGTVEYDIPANVLTKTGKYRTQLNATSGGLTFPAETYTLTVTARSL